MNNRMSMKAACKPFPQVGVEIVVLTGITDGMATLAIYSGASTTQTYLTPDELSALIENLSNARDELIRAEFSFPAIEAIEVAA